MWQKLGVIIYFGLSSILFAEETADYSDYDVPSQSRKAENATKRNAPQRRGKKSYRSELKEIEAEDAEVQKGLPFSMTQVFVGPVITRGAWTADPSKTLGFIGGVGKLLHVSSFFVDLNLEAMTGINSPRFFLLGMNMGGGVYLPSQHLFPFVGFQAGVARMTASGRGSVFGFRGTPEVGFFPLKIKGYPLSVKFQYSWMTSRLAGSLPSWFSLLIGIGF